MEIRNYMGIENIQNKKAPIVVVEVKRNVNIQIGNNILDLLLCGPV